METENILSDFQTDNSASKIIDIILALTAIVTITNFVSYIVPNFSKYPLQFHLVSFNSYFSIITKLILPTFGMIWFSRKKKKGWVILTFISSFSILHSFFWMV